MIGRAGTSTCRQTLRSASLAILIRGLFFALDFVHVQIAQGGQLRSGRQVGQHRINEQWRERTMKKTQESSDGEHTDGSWFP